MQRAILTGHEARGLTLFADEDYLRTAMMWHMGIKEFSDNDSREAFDTDFSTALFRVKKRVADHRGNWSAFFKDAILSQLMDDSHLEASHLASKPAVLQEMKDKDRGSRGNKLVAKLTCLCSSLHHDLIIHLLVSHQMQMVTARGMLDMMVCHMAVTGCTS